MNISRRQMFMQVGAAALVYSSAASRFAFAETAEKLSLTIAGYSFDRFRGLMDGSVGVEGCDVTFEADAIGDMNTHIFSGPGTRDVTEVGLHPYMLAYANEGFRDYTLLPIFPIRTFRHKSIFIRTDRGIEKPQDLVGKTIGTPGYSSTSLTWIRGILQDEYGVSPTDVKWVVAAGDSSAGEAGKISAQESRMPDGIDISTGPAGMDESDLLEEGMVDALFHAAEPRGYQEGHPKIARLFTDFKAVEQDYYKRTGIFPIMHAVAIKRSVSEAHPWLAKAVFDAYSKAKAQSYRRMDRLGWASDMLPWYGHELEATRALMGNDFYSYGLEPNRNVLETLFRYSHEQGLAQQLLTVEELFDPRSLDF